MRALLGLAILVISSPIAQAVTWPSWSPFGRGGGYGWGDGMSPGSGYGPGPGTGTGTGYGPAAGANPGSGYGWGTGENPGSGYGPGWCTGGGTAGCPGGPYFEVRDARTPVTPRGDVELVDTLVPHHQRALDMAGMEVASGSSAQVKQLAQQIIDQQSNEVDRLLTIRERLTGCRDLAGYADPTMDAEIEAMRSLSGADLDRAFLQSMIPHHAGAIQESHAAMPNLQDADTRTLADEVVREQVAQIGQMQALLDAM